MKKYLVIIVAVLFISGCDKDKKEQPVVENKKPESVEPNETRLKPVLYFGMYGKNKNEASLYECKSGRKFLIPQKAETAIIDTVYNSFQKKHPGKRIYLTIEGFVSVQEKSKGPGFDTVLVVTRLMGSDDEVDCEK